MDDWEQAPLLDDGAAETAVTSWKDAPLAPPDLTLDFYVADVAAQYEERPGVAAQNDRRVLDDWIAARVPFVGGYMEGDASARINEAAQRVKEGKANQLDYLNVAREIVNQERFKTSEGAMGVAEDIFHGATRLPAFMTEFASTGGLYKGAKGAVQAVVGTGAKSTLGKAAQATVPRLAGAAAQTTAMSNVAATAGQMTDDDTNFLQALPKAYADSLIETLAERSGGKIVEGVGGAAKYVAPALTAKLAALKKAIADRWVKTLPGRTAAMFDEALKAGGWNGIMGEFLEERAGEAARVPLGLQAPEDALLTAAPAVAAEAATGNFGPAAELGAKTGRQALVEAGILAIPAGIQVAGRVAGRQPDQQPTAQQPAPVTDTMSQTGEELPRVDRPGQPTPVSPPVEITEEGEKPAPATPEKAQDTFDAAALTKMPDRDLGERLRVIEEQLEAIDDLTDPRYDSLSIEEQLVRAEINKRLGRDAFTRQPSTPQETPDATTVEGVVGGVETTGDVQPSGVSGIAPEGDRQPGAAVLPEADIPAQEKRPEPESLGAAEPAAATKREFSSTQVNLPADVAGKVKAVGQKIADEDLADDGREDEPHVTVKYGLHTDDVDDVRKLVESEPPIRVKLGKVSLFPAKEGGAQYDVVKADVDSEDLRRINAKIAAALPNTDTFPTYEPHVTLAYVKPGAGQKYAGMADLEGTEIVLDKLVFSDKSRQHHEIKLAGKRQPKTVVPAETTETAQPEQKVDTSTTTDTVSAKPKVIGESGQTAIPGMEDAARIGEARDEEDARWEKYVEQAKLEIDSAGAEQLRLALRDLTGLVRTGLAEDSELSAETIAGNLQEQIELANTGNRKTNDRREESLNSILEGAVNEAYGLIVPEMKEAGGWKIGQSGETSYPRKFGKITRFDVGDGMVVAVVQPNDEAKERTYDLTDLTAYEPEGETLEEPETAAPEPGPAPEKVEQPPATAPVELAAPPKADTMRGIHDPKDRQQWEEITEAAEKHSVEQTASAKKPVKKAKKHTDTMSQTDEPTQDLREPTQDVAGSTAVKVPLNLSGGPASPRTVSARDIVATMAREFGTKLQYGRVPRGVAGNYAVWSEVVRVSNAEMASLATETHEIAHDLDKKTEVIAEAVGDRRRPNWSRLIRRAEQQHSKVVITGKGQKWLDKWSDRLVKAGAPQPVIDAVKVADFRQAEAEINRVLGPATQEQLDIAAELAALDYQPMDRIEEGFAEWARTFLTRDDVAQKAPKFTRWMREIWLPKHPKWQRAFAHAKSLIDIYRAQTPLERAQENRAKAGDQPKALDVPKVEAVKEWAGTALDKLAADWTDPYHFLELLEKDWQAQGGVQNPLENTTVEFARYADGTTSNHVNRSAFGDGIRSVSKGRAKFFSKSLMDVFKPIRDGKFDPEEWDSWHVARHIVLDVAPRLAAANQKRALQGKQPIHYNPGMRFEDAEAIYNQIKGDPAKYAVFEKVSKDFSKFGDAILEMLADSGVITNELATKLKGFYRNHASLRKVRPGSIISRLFGTSEGALNVANPVRRRSMKGHGLPLMSQVDAMYARLHDAYHAALVHSVKTAILNKVVRAPSLGFNGLEGLGHWATIEEPHLKKLEFEAEEFLGQLVKKGFIEETDAKLFRVVDRLRDGAASAKDIEFLEAIYGTDDIQDLLQLTADVPSLAETLVTYRPDYKPSESEFIEVMMIRGKPRLIRWNPHVYDILRRMGPLQLNTFERMLAWAADVQRLGTTGLNVRFGVKQLFADYLGYLPQAKEAGVRESLTQPLVSLGKIAYGISQEMMGQRKLPSLELAEGTYGSLFEEMQPDAAGAIYLRRSLFVGGALDKAWHALREPSLYVRTVHNTVRSVGGILAQLDLPPRLTEGVAMLKRHGYVEKRDPTGVWRWWNENNQTFEDPPIELERKFLVAMADATVPFRRLGHKARYINRVLFPYFGPWLAGQVRMAETIKSAALGNKRAQAGLLAGTIAMIGMSFLMQFLTAGDDDKEEEEQWTKSGYWQFGDSFALRKPQSWSWIPNAAEAIMGMFYAEDGGLDAARKYAIEELRNQVYFEMPGLDNDPVLGNVAKLSAIGPIAEVVSNRKTFQDRPIEPDYMEGLPAAERYDARTSLISRAVGQVTGPALDIGPKKVDYLAQRATGGLLTRNPLENPLKGYAPQASTREFDERFTDLESRRKAARMHGQEWPDEKESEYDKLYAAKRMMVEMFKLTRAGELDEDLESKYRVGVARQALGKEPLESFPDLFRDYAQLPPALKGLVDERMASLARKVLAGKPVSLTEKEKESGLTLDAKREAWRQDRATARKELAENGVGKDAILSAIRSWIKDDLKSRDAEIEKMRRFRNLMSW